MLLARGRTGQPTELELEILSVLWRDGPSTLRHLVERVAAKRKQTKQAIHNTLRIMSEKGYVRVNRRAKSEGGNVYVACVARAKTASQMLHTLTSKIFGGSIASAIQHLVKAGELDPAELESLRKSLDENHEGNKP